VPTCPICRRPFERRKGEDAYPFCGERCRLLDLGKWLGEDYRVPAGRPGDGEGNPHGEEEG
jgi:uncharacterized protein